jgi:glutathione peroxidase
MSRFYEFKMHDIRGNEICFEKYKGQVCLVVNVASECGYTPQYDQLQSLYEDYRNRGLGILGFPCNQFANEEPGNEDQILEFCESNYEVTFDLFEKIKVKGENAEPLYNWLTSQVNPWGPHKVRWNFQKYLLNRDGVITQTFDPMVEPSSTYFMDRFNPMFTVSG